MTNKKNRAKLWIITPIGIFLLLIALIIFYIIKHPIILLAFQPEPSPDSYVHLCSLKVLEETNGKYQVQFIHRDGSINTSPFWVNRLEGMQNRGYCIGTDYIDTCDLVGDNRIQAWDYAGRLVSDVSYKDTNLHGPFKTWYISDKPEREHYYNDDVCTGEKREWYKSGELHRVAQCEGFNIMEDSFEKDGTLYAREFSKVEDGNVFRRTDHYKDGKITRSEPFWSNSVYTTRKGMCEKLAEHNRTF